jgi:hypothetical protein
MQALGIKRINIRLALVCKVKDYTYNLEENSVVNTILSFKKYGMYKDPKIIQRKNDKLSNFLPTG